MILRKTKALHRPSWHPAGILRSLPRSFKLGVAVFALAVIILTYLRPEAEVADRTYAPSDNARQREQFVPHVKFYDTRGGIVGSQDILSDSLVVLCFGSFT